MELVSSHHGIISLAPSQTQTYSSPGARSSSKNGNKRALYRNQDETLASTVYHEYPRKPFLNDDYVHDPDKPVSTSPENNRKAVIAALKNLRQKIHKLEVERSAAENNLKSLAEETHRYKDILQRERENVGPAPSYVTHQTHELESQLKTAESRSQTLERQLEKMKKLVSDAETDKQDAVIQSTAYMMEKHSSERQQPSSTSHGGRLDSQEAEQEMYLPKFDSQAEKISNLEREQLKLTATQTIAENKIRELEEKLKEEKMHRQFMQDRAAELQTEAETIRNIPGSRPVSAKAKKVKKKKKVASSKRQKTHCQSGQPCERYTPSKHYRLNLADIPFVAGKSSGPSHSVGANVQRVLHLMKSHNLALCASHTPSPRSLSPSESSSSDSLDQDIAELLLQLQDEFGTMSFEHEELSKEINEVTDPKLREDLERELDSLVARMEAKGQQISKVRAHQEKLQEKKKKPGKKSHTKGVTVSNECHSGGEVEVTTTIKTKGTGVGKVSLRPNSGREVSLNVLKDMKKLQTTLRKDDLHWE